MAIKFLVSVPVVGMVIGKGGSNIKKFGESTSTFVSCSSMNEYYPETDSRILTIEGDLDSVTIAQTILWEVIALEATHADISVDSFTWNPPSIPTRMYDNTEVEGQISVPQACAGLIIGKGGAKIQSLMEKHGVTAQMSGRDESNVDITQERVISLVGTAYNCSQFVSSVLELMANAEGGEGVYAIKRGHYADGAQQQSHNEPKQHREPRDNHQREPRRGRGREVAEGSRNGGGGRERGAGRGGGGLEMISSEATLNFAVPDSRMGHLIGPMGANLKEIMAATGVEITASNKGEFIEGTNNRLVTIVGAPAAADAAYKLLAKLL